MEIIYGEEWLELRVVSDYEGHERIFWDTNKCFVSWNV